MEKQFKITAPNGWSGTMFSTLTFNRGVAVTGNPAFLAYFKRHTAYKVEEIKLDNKTTTKSRKKEVKTDD